MKLLTRIRDSYGALQIIYSISWLINLFCRRFDREKNRETRSSAALPAGRLNGQDTGPLAQLPLGAWRMGCNGCEVIAAYNALLSLGRGKPLSDVADALERRGLMFNGFGGTNLGALTAYLRRCGLGVQVLRRRAKEQFDTAFAQADCAVLSYWTGTTLRRSDGDWNTLHTVSVHHTPTGVEVCNAHSRSTVPEQAESIGAFLRRTGGAPVCLLLLGEKAVDKAAGKRYNIRRTTR